MAVLLVGLQLPLFFFYYYGDHRDLHSFPTRRSSDLVPRAAFSHSASVGTRPPAQLQNAVASCQDRKSTRLNSSHLVRSYAAFCWKKKTAPLPPPTRGARSAPTRKKTKLFHSL